MPKRSRAPAAGPVLVAEDDDDFAELVRLMLQAAGVTSVRVRTGREVLELLPRLKPKILLLDLTMPVMDGFEVLRRLKKARPRPAVVAMSAFWTFLPEAERAGAAAALRKPFTSEELLRALAQARSVRPPRLLPPRPPSEGLPEVLEDPEETERVRRLYCLRVMSPETDPALDEIVRAAAELLRTPVALVSIITRDRQWWKAMHGVKGDLAAARGTARELSLCTHAVAARSPLVVHDARRHPFFERNPLVRAGVITSYAGVPVVIPEVGALGTLCVLDPEPRVFSTEDLELLGLLGERVAAEIEWREKDRLGNRPLGTFQYLAMVDERHGIYNPRAFRSLAGAVARQALLRRDVFALAAFARAARPEEAEGAELESLVGAVRSVAGPGALLGRLGDAVVGVLLSRAGRREAEAFVDAVLREAEKVRARAAPAGVALTSPGDLTAEAIVGAALKELSQRLSRHTPP